MSKYYVGTIECELTDTFGAQANYSWVNRKSILVNGIVSVNAIIRRVKKAYGLNGTRCDVEYCTVGGVDIVIRPRGANLVLRARDSFVEYGW